jgi:hypothetical protein
MLDMEACEDVGIFRDKVHKRPHFDPSSPRSCKRPGKEPSVSGPSVVGEGENTLGSTSETAIDNDAALDSIPGSSFSATFSRMGTIALDSEDVTGHERLNPVGSSHLGRDEHECVKPWEGTNLNASPPGEADGQDESMQQHSDSTDWQYGPLNSRAAVSTCSSNFDSHAGIREMNINR